jgi:hypothetical protein
MVVIKAAGRAVAIRVRAWRAVRQESAAGVSGSPYVILTKNKVATFSNSLFLPQYFKAPYYSATM